MSNVPARTRDQLPSIYASNAIDEVMDDNPKREMRLGFIIVGVFFGLFLGWALIARLDQAAYAQGQVSVAGRRQAVQHLEGGRVAAIHVKEGQKVNAGDVLIQLAPADVGAAERAMTAQVISLQALIARLEAERDGRGSITPPPLFATLTGDQKLEAENALRLQQRELSARHGAIQSQKAVLQQRMSQLSQMVEGYTNQVQATEEQSKLIQDELVGTRGLAERGYASQNRVRALERNSAALSGQKAELSANAARSRDQIAETRMQALDLDARRFEEVSAQLRETQAQLNDLLPRWEGMREKLAGATIRAPATGQVMGLAVNTVGGVIQPAEPILEIVPEDVPMVIEAQVSPTDADDLYVGQETEVKIMALHERNLPILKGRISRVSADSFRDERSGQTFFTAEVTVPASELKIINQIRGEKGGLKPGMPVQVMVPLRKRTAFQYLVEPLTQAMWRSFREP
jgi:HlyD family secretion protein